MHRCKKLYEGVIYLVRCHIVQLKAGFTNLDIHTYQSYCT